MFMQSSVTGKGAGRADWEDVMQIAMMEKYMV
jgi:hypothetical protein